MDSNNNIEQETNLVSKDKSQRSASYPSVTVNKSFDFALRINEQFSTVAEVSREEIAAALKMNAGSIIRDISACVQYGFLNKNTAEGKYQLTDLFTDIFRPDSEKDKRIAYMRAFGSPKLNAELIAKFENNIIPNELPNTLIKYHNIRKEVAQSAADIFIESGRYVGVINENRVLKYSVTLSTTEKTQYAVIEDIPINESNNNEKRNQIIPAFQKTGDQKNISIPIHLIGDKMAMFAYPENLTEDDVEIIKHQIEGILLRIRLSQKNKGAVTTPSENSGE